MALERVEWPTFTKWLNSLPRPVFVEVATDLDYLVRFGRAAALPYVRQRVQESAHFPDMCETRTRLVHDGQERVLRCLAVIAPNDNAVVFCVGGDKALWARQNPRGPDWYDTWVPVADQVFRQVKRQKGWP